MKKLLFLITLFLCFDLQAQPTVSKVLNKEAVYSSTSLLQDYDGDGDLDIILSRSKPDGVFWLENEPTKQFPIRPLFTTGISFYIADIDMADFDQDGDMDYAVCMTGVTDGELSWFQRQSDGSYIKWTIVKGKDFIMADVADFNGDGRMDIVAVGLGNSDETCRMYLNDGNLFFTEKIIISEDATDAVDADDLDGDGDIDLAVAGGGFVDRQVGTGSGSRTMINDGKGNFSHGEWLIGNYISFTGIWETLRIVDLNKDGVKDILSFHSVAFGGLDFFKGPISSTGTWVKAELLDDDNDIDLGGDFVVFDINGDNRLDIVRQCKGADRVSVLYQTANFTFQREYIELKWDTGKNPTAKMSVGDLDNDGDLDLVFPEQGNIDGDISWFENINGKLRRHLLYSELRGARIPKLADIDKDGDSDILLTVSSNLSDEEDELLLYENIGNNNFINWRLNDSLDMAADVEPADIDGDGDLDVFASATKANDLVWMRNDGSKSNWETKIIDSNVNEIYGIVAVDLDKDNDNDVVVCSRNDDKIFWYRNNGKGEFNKLVVDANVDAPFEIEAADIDGDGDIDLAMAANSITNTGVLYLNNGSQSFTRQILLTGKSASDLEIADWNQDGRKDILFSLYAPIPASPQQEIVSVINNGSNIFVTRPIIINAEKGTSLKVVDLDKDGNLDLLIGRNDGLRLIAWMRNNNGNLTQNVISTLSSGTGQVFGIEVGDMNNDGKNEVIFADARQNELVLTSFNCFVGPRLSITASNATCGRINGAVSIDVFEGTGASYRWNNGATTSSITGLNAGTFTVTVTSKEGCTSTATANISAPATANISVQNTRATCNQANGKAFVVKNNNIGINGFRWSNGATTDTLFNLNPGTYTVTATDVNGCTVTASTTVSATSVATLTATPVSTSCGKEDGRITLSSSGGSAIRSFLWNNGSTQQNLNDLAGGTYMVTATDANGCKISAQAIVVGRSNPVVQIRDTSISAGQSVVLDASGAGIVSYVWSTGATSAQIVVNSGGLFSVTVTNSAGCKDSDTITVKLISSTRTILEDHELTVAPNPTKDVIHLTCTYTTQSALIIDPLGRQLMVDVQPALANVKRSLDISDFPAGVYYVQVNGKGFTKTVRIVKTNP